MTDICTDYMEMCVAGGDTQFAFRWSAVVAAARYSSASEGDGTSVILQATEAVVLRVEFDTFTRAWWRAGAAAEGTES